MTNDQLPQCPKSSRLPRFLASPLNAQLRGRGQHGNVTSPMDGMGLDICCDLPGPDENVVLFNICMVHPYRYVWMVSLVLPGQEISCKNHINENTKQHFLIAIHWLVSNFETSHLRIGSAPISQHKHGVLFFTNPDVFFKL